MKDSRNKNLWKIYSYFYDNLLAFQPYSDLLSLVLLRANFKEGETVVDLGSGTGNLEILNKIPNIRFVCFDASEEMTKFAQKKAPKNKYIIANLNKYPFDVKDNFADKVVSCNLIYNILDLDSFFREVSRILKPSSYFVFTTSTKNEVFPIIREAFRKINLRNSIPTILKLPGLLSVFLINIFIDRSKKFKFYSAKVLVDTLEKYGFEAIETEECYGGVNILVKAKKKAS